MRPVFLILLLVVPFLLASSVHAQQQLLPENPGFLARSDIQIDSEDHEVRVASNSDVNGFEFDIDTNTVDVRLVIKDSFYPAHVLHHG